MATQKTGKKRTNEVDAEKLPKKKTKDSSLDPPSKAPTNAPSIDTTCLVGETRSNISSTRATINRPSSVGGEDQTGASGGNGGVVVMPPRSTISEATHGATVSSTTAAIPSTTAVAETSTGTISAIQKVAIQSVPSTPQTKKVKTPWIYSTVFGLALLLLLSNLLTLGLWMQYSLEIDLAAREVTLVAKEEVASQLDAFRLEVQEKSEKIEQGQQEMEQLKLEVQEKTGKIEQDQQEMEQLHEKVKELHAAVQARQKDGLLFRADRDRINQKFLKLSEECQTE